MRELRHCGEFADEQDAAWRWEIWQEPPFGASDADVRVTYDDNLRLAWEAADLHQPLCPSAATLTAVSATDREFADLYTLDPTAVELRAYKDGELQWRGFLDPEFYEEPYSELEGYDVSLTFTDMGPMGRAKFSLEGIATLRAVLGHALQAVDASLDDVDATAISTMQENGSTILDIGMDCANYYDETGEPMSRSEALEAALAPLGLRLVQKQGKWRLYDLNALARRDPAAQVRWLVADRLSAAPTYSTFRAAWSTYCLADLGGADADPWGDTPPTPDSLTNLYSAAPKESGGADYWSYPLDEDDVKDSYPDPEFTLWTKPEISGATLCNSALRCFKVVEQLGGEDCQGIAVAWPATWKNAPQGGAPEVQASYYGLDTGALSPAYTDSHGWEMTAEDRAKARPLFKTDPIAIPHGEGTLRLRVTLPMLMDRCINPFEEDQDRRIGRITSGQSLIEYVKYADFLRRLRYVHVPIGLYLRGHSGTLYALRNYALMNPAYRPGMEQTCGTWIEVDKETPGLAFLQYRDNDDKDRDVYKGRWCDNKPLKKWREPGDIGSKNRKPKTDSGQVCAYPPEGGELWLEVYDWAWLYKCYTYGHPVNFAPTWLLFKMPTIEIIKASGYDTAIDTDDREAAYTINPKAKDELSLDFTCGMAEEDVPAARSAYLYAATGRQQHTLHRSGRSGTCFDLLAGTLFSQYAARHTLLSGTAITPPWGTLTDPAQDPDARFLPTEEAQDCRAATSEITLTEISPDEYDLEDIQQNQ